MLIDSYWQTITASYWGIILRKLYVVLKEQKNGMFHLRFFYYDDHNNLLGKIYQGCPVWILMGNFTTLLHHRSKITPISKIR